MRLKKMIVLGLMTVVLAGLAWGGLVLAGVGEQPPPHRSYGTGDFFFPPYPSDSDRMGFDKASAHDATALNAGWYLNWGTQANPDHPGGAEYARLIMLHTNTGWCTPATKMSQVTPALTGTALINAVQTNPGALWMIGNEADSLYNGDPIQAELYAELYHYFYSTIKAADPTAKVSVAAIVQPSPLRLEYLDKVLNHYQATYGRPLSADLWNIHFYILNEGPCGSWGGAVPPFSSQSNGWKLDFSAATMLDLGAMRNNLHAFRQWMADRGYRDMPLLITEFGVLPPPSFQGFSNQVSAQFLNDMFAMFLTETDPEIGYPADDDRLVQMWAWFSTFYGPYGGDLFEQYSNDMTVIGQAFAAQTEAHFSPYVDLRAIPAKVEPAGTAIFTPTESAVIAVDAHIDNRGNITASEVQARVRLIDYFSRAIIDETDYELDDLGRRYNHTPAYVGGVWTVTVPGAYTVTVTANPNQILSDANPANDHLVQQFAWYPELVVDRLWVTPIMPKEEAFTDTDFTETVLPITTTVTNIGNWTAAGSNFQWQIQKDSGRFEPMGDPITLTTLAPQANIVLTTTWTVTEPGLYRLRGAINSDGQPYVDLDPGNNIATYDLLIGNYYYTFMPLLLKD